MSQRRPSRDEQVRAVTAELNLRMDELRVTVATLSAILTGTGSDDTDPGERLAKPA